MKYRIDNILLTLLWLLAGILGASFWFYTIFSFNIFSAKHWEYLSYLQASQSQIKSTFYISFVIIIFIMLFGLYVLIRPKFRKIKLQKPIKTYTQNTEKSEGMKAKPITDTDSSNLNKLPETHQSLDQKEYPQPNLIRPPRLNIPNVNILQNADRKNVKTTSNQTAKKQQEYPEIKEIFSEAGYIVKDNPKINGEKTALFAIGTNENLWIGCVDIKSSLLNSMISKLSAIFTDTLEDIYININGFIIKSDDSDDQ